MAVRAEVKADWPDAEGSTLMGAVWALTCKLDDVLTTDPLQAGAPVNAGGNVR